MEVEIHYKGNCISQYNTLLGNEYINKINNPYRSKRGFTELHRELCVCHLVCIGVRFEKKHALKFLSVLLLVTVTIHVAVLQFLFDQYTLCTGIPLHFPRYTITILSTLIISILPQNIIAIQQK